MSNKTFLIIGGNQGIGQACFNKIIQQGNLAVTITRSPFPSTSDMHISLNADVCDSFPDLQQHIEKIDGIIYCPGSINLKPFTSLKKQDFLNDFEKNVLGLINTIQNCLPLLKNNKASSVVAFSTVACQLGMSYHSSIATSKSAIEGLIKSLAAEYATHKIRFNAIAPSIVDTPLASKILSSDIKKKEIANKHPLKTIGSAEEIADIALFLLSDSSAWVTGQVIHADGGLSSISKI